MDLVRSELKAKIDREEEEGERTNFVLLALTRMNTTIETFPMEDIVTSLTLESFVGEAPEQSEEQRSIRPSPSSFPLTREDFHRWNKTSDF